MNALVGFAQGYQVGDQITQGAARNALSASVKSGDMRGSMNALADLDPVAAMQMQQPDRKAQREAASGLVRGVLAVPEELRPQAWGAALAQAQQMGMDVSSVPPEYPGAEYTQMLGGMLGLGDAETTEFERLIQMAGPDAAREAVMVKLGLAPGADAQLRVGAQKQEADPIAALRLRAAEAGMQPGTPEYQQFMAQGGASRSGGGMTVFDPVTGNPIVQTGAGAPGQLGRAGQNAVEQLQIDAQKSLGRLEAIEGRFRDNPELLESLTAAGQLERWGLQWADFIAPGKLNDEQRKKLFEVTQARSDVLDNLNFTIKEITGAAMTEGEAKRIGATMPNVNDTPTEFVAKLEAATTRTRLAIARYNYWRAGGFGDAAKPEDATTLGDMEGLMRKRGQELYQEAVGRGLKGDAALDDAAGRLSEEFGV